jgi:hypothetical protein
MTPPTRRSILVLGYATRAFLQRAGILNPRPSFMASPGCCFTRPITRSPERLCLIRAISRRSRGWCATDPI